MINYISFQLVFFLLIFFILLTLIIADIYNKYSFDEQIRAGKLDFWLKTPWIIH